MRKEYISGITVEYPDEISFCFNPVVINISGYTGASVGMAVIDMQTGGSYTETRAMFGSACFFEASFYMQSAFDTVDFKDVDYSENGAKDSKAGKLFKVILILYASDGSIDADFQFETFVIWGAMKIGERYNGERTLVCFRNLPFTVGMYSTGGDVVNVIDGGVQTASYNILEQKVWNIVFESRANEVVLEIPVKKDNSGVFDYTYDYTFHKALNTPSKVRLIMDDCTEGIYLRWINRHGFYCYWLFKKGDESKTVTNDGEFLRNNMQDYSYVNGYHGGTGRKQKKAEENTLLVCAPLVDSDTYDFLYQIALSPIVDMYMGFGTDAIDCWMGINISVGTYNKTRAVLQDFIATIVLPETRIQSL